MRELAAISLADRTAIADLFVRYATALDAGDVATVVDCFTGDAVLQSPVIGTIAGRMAIRDFAERFAGRRAAGTQFRHLATNIAVEIADSGNRARASADLLTRDGVSRWLPSGRYECDVVKEDDAWRFSSRTVFHDHDYTLDGI